MLTAGFHGILANSKMFFLHFFSHAVDSIFFFSMGFIGFRLVFLVTCTFHLQLKEKIDAHFTYEHDGMIHVVAGDESVLSPSTVSLPIKEYIGTSHARKQLYV